MTPHRFHNGLRILLNLDRIELVDAGVLRRGDHAAWETFCGDPYRFFIRVDDAKREALWKLIEARQPPAVNLITPLQAAYHALRSYQYGNGSPDLAIATADACAAALTEAGATP
ncbi:hypothetical protein [Allomesorhizobium alhagi]|uniref:Uncharacterized protein n=1 Tax=Mesorhizobium alhagi CCNWXJ12-2 TaxID=1107882 RepID=H0HNL4_9HYPH|nr:hypothetical protein [Mesorhizobium alhagi]EHK57667.1 hypothetical protein MAXJ12_08684 [Mesorhizobium alhagi CCNWXJ12-2]